MAQLVTNLYVGYWGQAGKDLAVDLSGNISRSAPGTVLVSGITGRVYRRDGQQFWSTDGSSRTWGLKSHNGVRVSTSVYYGDHTNSKAFSLPNLSFALDSGATSCQMYVTGPDGDFGFTMYGIPIGVQAPQGSKIQALEIYADGAKLRGSVTSWGVPSTQSARSMDIKLVNDDFTEFRGNLASNIPGTSLDVTLTNGTLGGRGVIRGNVQYNITMQAANAETAAGEVRDKIYTNPYAPANLRVTKNDRYGHVELAYEAPTTDKEGEQSSITAEYNLNGAGWKAFTPSKSGQTRTFALTFTDTASKTVQVRRKGHRTSGTASVTFVPELRFCHFYGSVDGKTKEVATLYCSVDGKARKITHLYGSKDGKAVEIFTNL